MAFNDKDTKNHHVNLEDEDDQGVGGATGAVQFRYKDSLSTGPSDDMLPPAELKRILAVHKDLHKARVDKQKITRKERAAMKEGRTLTASKQAAGRGLRGGAGGRASPFKQHPISNSAQFSGIDHQVTALPSENDAETNPEQRADLENRYQLTHQNVPKFNPKPRPY